MQKGRKLVVRDLNTKGEFNADINVPGHLDDLGELDGLLSGDLEILDREDLEARFADL